MNGFENAGRAFEALRRRRQLTRMAVAQLARVSPTMIYNIEREDGIPMFRTMGKLMEALQVDRYELLNAMLQVDGRPQVVALPGKSELHLLSRNLLELLDLDLPPEAETTFLAMVESLRKWFADRYPPPAQAAAESP